MDPYTWQGGRYQVARLSLSMDDSAVPWLRAAIRDVATAAGFPSDSLHSLLVGTTEACSNAIKHGVHAPERAMEADIRINSTEVIVRLYYSSEPFVFAIHADSPADGAARSGLGHSLMCRMLDEVHYRFRRGWAMVRLVKRA
jgi:anti-sigma regulatory factor (Ser/Thr protein kinase)